MNKWIINSLLDCDIYKFNMLRVYFYRFSNATARFVFKCRDKDVVFTQKMTEEIKAEVDHICDLMFSEEDVQVIASLYYHKTAKGFHEFLRIFKLNKKYIHIDLEDNGKLNIYADGPLFIVTMFEIYVLSIVSEVYHRNTYTEDYGKLIDGALSQLDRKIELIKKSNIPFTFIDFGARRRYSFDLQDKIDERLVEKLPATTFIGNSDVFFATKYNQKIFGSMAHELLCLGQAENVTLASSQTYMFRIWADEYSADLGTALTDNLTFDFFLKHFGKYECLLFSGIRHDSGDPIEWGEKAIAHYESIGIDPMTKTLFFSDNLNFPIALNINKHFHGRAKVSFGIGTNITCDVPGVKPLNIVMKMVEANGRPVAKISDADGKLMCQDSGFVTYLKDVIRRELSRK